MKSLDSPVGGDCRLQDVSDDPLMPIGVFSTATLVSVKALRLYHEQGLLVPAAIDPTTGYRSYRVSQLVDAQVIKRLRDLDLPLRAVAEIVRARDPEVTRRLIADHDGGHLSKDWGMGGHECSSRRPAGARALCRER